MNEELRARLSLIHNSVQRCNLHSHEEFEQELAGASIDDTVIYYISPNALYKTCLEVNPKRKTLQSTVQKWVDKWSRKQKLGVKFTSSNNLSSPREVLDDYTRKVCGKGSKEKKLSCENHDNPKRLMGCALLADQSPADLLSLYHPYPRGTLVQGIVQSCYSTSTSSQKSFDSASADAFLGNNGCVHGNSNNHNKQHEMAILRSAAVLYYQIWYFRAIAAKDVSEAYGFAITSSTSSQSTDTTDSDTESPNDVVLSVTLLVLKKPTTGPIGGRYSLYEYTQTYTIQNFTDKDHNHHGKIWNELGHFLLSRNLPCPFLEAANLTTSTQSPGYMLLPANSYKKQMQEEPWQVIPTITGSLVIRVTGGVDWIRTLLLRGTHFGRDDGEANDVSALLADLETMVASERERDNHCPQETESDDDVWYIKFKTPPLGSFWDTSILAINGPRSILQRKWDNAAGALVDPIHRLFVQEWLRMYPMDSHIITKSRAITISRSAGGAFLGPTQSSWKDFQLEFASLMTGTILFQNLCNNLIHGDINEGNVLYDQASQRGNRLKLIDWDEALRGRPCHRQITTEEERFRYPVELVTFPERYTKQQFLHLFATLVQKHYRSVASNDEKWKDLTKQSKFFVPGNEQDPNNRTSLSRLAVDARFQELLDTLQTDILHTSIR